MNRFILRINQLMLSQHKTAHQLKKIPKIINGDKVCIEYAPFVGVDKDNKKVWKKFEGIVVQRKRLSIASGMLVLLNYDLEYRVEKAFFINNPFVRILNITPLAVLRKANCRWLINSPHARKLISKFKPVYTSH